MEIQKNIKVEQLEHCNQFVITNGDVILFQSYNSVVAGYNRATERLVLFRDWDYSHNTLRHLYLFIRKYTNLDIKNKKEILKAYDNSIIDIKE